MTIPALKILIERIETWPVERQERAAAILERLDADDGDDLAVPDEEVAEIERRLEAGRLDTVSLDEFRATFAAYLK